jgi:hypothetical protein
VIPDSRQTIYAAINYVVVPAPRVDSQYRLKYQQALSERGIEYDNVALQGLQLLVRRVQAPSLVVRVVGAAQGAVGQLGVVGPGPAVDVELFLREVEAVGEAYGLAWGQNGQIISLDVTLRDLFECSGKSAFEEIWVDKLGRTQSELAPFGRSVDGGGVRLVMRPDAASPDPTEAQVRIESFLHQRERLWIETIFKWVKPRSFIEGMNARLPISTVSDFVESAVVDYLVSGESPS